MNQITQQTLEEIKKFSTNKGYILSRENPIYCPQVNGLTNVCIRELGINIYPIIDNTNFQLSSSYNSKSGLFHREVAQDGKIIFPAFNTCKNACFALALSVSGFNEDADKIMLVLKKSPLYIKEKGLFGREYNPFNGNVNPLIITQSNLWMALAYSSLGKNGGARKIMRNLERERYSQDVKMFDSQDCRYNAISIRFFVDDQALAILTYLRIGEDKKARNLADSVLNSFLYDSSSGLFNSSSFNSEVDRTKSTYKNSLMAFALGMLGYSNELGRVQEGLVRELYDTKERLFNQTTRDRTKVPDNSALALVALEYDNLRHVLF